MRISEMIEKLETLKEEKGDVKVFIPARHGSVEANAAFFIAPSLHDNCKEERVLIDYQEKSW